MANNSFIHRSKTYQLFVVVLTSLLAALGGVFLCLRGVYSSLVLGVVGGAAIIGSCIGAFGLVSYLLSVIRNQISYYKKPRKVRGKFPAIIGF